MTLRRALYKVFAYPHMVGPLEVDPGEDKPHMVRPLEVDPGEVGSV